MAHHKSAIKRIKTSENHRTRNKAQRTRIRNAVKQVGGLVEEGKTAEAEAKLPEVESRIMAAAGKGLLHKKTASRRVSRLAKAINRVKKA